MKNESYKKMWLYRLAGRRMSCTSHNLPFHWWDGRASNLLDIDERRNKNLHFLHPSVWYLNSDLWWFMWWQHLDWWKSKCTMCDATFIHWGRGWARCTPRFFCTLKCTDRDLNQQETPAGFWAAMHVCIVPSGSGTSLHTSRYGFFHVPYSAFRNIMAEFFHEP